MSNNVIVNGKVYAQGRSVTPTYTAVTVGNTTTAVLAADADCIGIELYNDSDTTMYFKFGAAAVLNQGFALATGNGVALSIDQFDSVHLALNAIASAGGKNLLVTVKKFS